MVKGLKVGAMVKAVGYCSAEFDDDVGSNARVDLKKTAAVTAESIRFVSRRDGF